MGLKLRWFRARMNIASSSTSRDFSAPTHGLYRPTYSMYETHTSFAPARSTRNLYQPDVATTLPPKQMSRSMPDLGDASPPPVTTSGPRVRTPRVQQNASSLHNSQAHREVAVAINPAFVQQSLHAPPQQEMTKSKNRLQLKLNIPDTTQNHKPSQPVLAAKAAKATKNKTKNKLAPTPPKQGQSPDSEKKDQKNKKGKKEVVDLQFGGESES